MTPNRTRSEEEAREKRLSPVQKARAARRAAALRENLRKRKSQSRARDGENA